MVQCIAIVAGKGGVGKSSVTVNLALALAAHGARVGVLDADLYGPSIGKMVPSKEGVKEVDGWIVPAQGLGLYTISLAYFSLGKGATIVRAPIANQMISEFVHHVKWPELDFLLIDFPPGTGDIQLTLMQEASLSGAILVTTPQEVARLDVEKAYEMLKQLQVPVLGVVENMSYYESHGERCYPFGQEGGRLFCERHGLKLLGEIPIDPAVSRCADQGVSLLEHSPGGGAALVFESIAYEMQRALFNKEASSIQEIKQQDLYHFSIVWSDGRVSTYPFSQLQRNCPCTNCRDEKTGCFIQDPAKIEERVIGTQIIRVGNYALRVEFESGCRSGIYTFSFLKQLTEREQRVG